MSSKKNLNSDKKIIHYCVGAIIKKDNQILLIDRNEPPFGIACIAGHMEEGETPEKALEREVFEETGLKVESSKLILEIKLDDNWCKENVTNHYWYLFECEISGKIKISQKEVKSIAWHDLENVKNLKLESSWRRLFNLINHP